MFTKKSFLILLIIFLIPKFLLSQVQLRDSVVTWKHHVFQLNPDNSIYSLTSADNSLEQVQFNAKVIENELIRLVVIPEYGARVISFVYKPTGHEYLYQSECGTPYGINEGNFYYNWLMVYGGIFPTFPEPEHGKTWFLPWNFDIVKNTGDSVVIGMEYTDNNSFTRAPGQFNNGITNITCRIEVGVYKGSSLWDFEVSLKNNKDQNVAYEYWTCTTLTPGSDIGNTGSPLNTEMIVPVDKYRAAWSPGSWIGSYGSLHDFSGIDYLSKWTDMGIAYADNLKDNYWGVINHDNNEGIFRISDNIETPGLKFWTWGKNNVDNNLYDISNGGADNYIELWAGVSESFFTDAILKPNENKGWIESYVPTTGLSSLTKINRNLALNIDWDQDSKEVFYELLTFNPGQEYHLLMYLEGEGYYSVVDETILAGGLGNSERFKLSNIPSGDYSLVLEVLDSNDELLLKAGKEISLIGTGIENLFSESNINPLLIRSLGNKAVSISIPVNGIYELLIHNVTGQLVYNTNFSGSSIDLTLPSNGLYVVTMKGEGRTYNQKLVIK